MDLEKDKIYNFVSILVNDALGKIAVFANRKYWGIYDINSEEAEYWRKASVRDDHIMVKYNPIFDGKWEDLEKIYNQSK